MKKYCPAEGCSFANIYEFEPPKFCQKCGYKFASYSTATVAPLQIKSKRKKVVQEETDGYEEEYIQSDIDFSHVKPFELESISNFRNTEKLGSLGLDNSEKINIDRPKGKKVSQKEFEENWRQELTKRGTNNVGGEPTEE